MRLSQTDGVQEPNMVVQEPNVVVQEAIASPLTSFLLGGSRL